MAPDHTQARKNIWKVQDNNFDGDLTPFLGEWKLNVEGRDPIDFFRHLFPADLIDDIVHWAGQSPEDVANRSRSQEDQEDETPPLKSFCGLCTDKYSTLQQSKRGRPSGTPQPVKWRAVTKVDHEVRFGTGYHWPQLTKVKMQTDAMMLHAHRKPNISACNAVCHCTSDALQTFIQPRCDEYRSGQ
ncbi:hypothetical protein PAMP_017435 [Pampus punctatissimus]